MIKNLKQLLLPHDGSMFSFGRALYKSVDCGPWTSFLFGNGKEVYYESKWARAPHQMRWRRLHWLLLHLKGFSHKNCVAIKIGSIVEGSDVSIEPRILTFPFREERMYGVYEDIDFEAKVEWELANVDSQFTDGCSDHEFSNGL